MLAICNTLAQRRYDMSRTTLSPTSSKWLAPRYWCRRLEDYLIRCKIPVVVPRVLRVIPHDESCFTQGLAFHDGLLYESGGGYGTSSLRAIDPTTGRIVRQVTVRDYFAEGIAIAGDQLIQLSWKEEHAGLFRVPTLEPTGNIRYAGQGWGLCRCPGGFLMSDGTSQLQRRDEAFQLIAWLPVRSRGLPVRKLNDLTWANGLVYANVWGVPELWEICPKRGAALRVWDCRSLQYAAPGGEEAVFNGVTYDPERDTLWVTGKHWRYLFELARE
jgi:glutamine cyclotransferase